MAQTAASVIIMPPWLTKIVAQLGMRPNNPALSCDNASGIQGISIGHSYLCNEWCLMKFIEPRTQAIKWSSDNSPVILGLGKGEEKMWTTHLGQLNPWKYYQIFHDLSGRTLAGRWSLWWAQRRLHPPRTSLLRRENWGEKGFKRLNTALVGETMAHSVHGGSTMCTSLLNSVYSKKKGPFISKS